MVLSAIFLKERVRIYRWSAVVLGFVGVLVILLPHFYPSRYTGLATTATHVIGAICGLTGAMINAGAVISNPQAYRYRDDLVDRVLFLAVLCAGGSGDSCRSAGSCRPPTQLLALIATGLIGGLSHIFLTESYRNAPQSVVAPFNYTTMLWALVFGYVFLVKSRCRLSWSAPASSPHRRTDRGVPGASTRQARYRRAAADSVTVPP